MKHIYLLTLIISSLLFSCDENENLSVEFDKGKYYIGDNPKGEVQEFIYNFYSKYNTLILTNPDTSDYRYNFTSMNKIKLIPPVKKDIYIEDLTDDEEKLLMDGLRFLKEVLFDQYTEEFKQKFFPATIQLADVIKKWNEGFDTITPMTSASRNFIAISGINSDLINISADKKEEYRREINYQLWYNHLLHGVNKVNIPKSFYAVSKDYYGTDEKYTDWEGDFEKSHNKGFIEGTIWGGYITDSEDVVSYLKHIFIIDRTKLNELMDNYPNIKLKYDILREAILKDFNIDINEMNK